MIGRNKAEQYPGDPPTVEKIARRRSVARGWRSGTATVIAYAMAAVVLVRV